MLTCPAARLTIAAGIKNGEILRGPPFSKFECSRSITSNPPIPEPICTPMRGENSSVTCKPEDFMASSAAAIARWMKRPIFVGDFDLKSFFEGHYQLYGVQRIGAQVVHERGVWRDFAFVNSQLFYDDLLYFFYQIFLFVSHMNYAS